MSPALYSRRAETVAATQWDGVISAQMLGFLSDAPEGSEWTWDPTEGTLTFDVSEDEAMMAFPGDWVLLTEDGYRPMHRTAFEQQYGAL